MRRRDFLAAGLLLGSGLGGGLAPARAALPFSALPSSIALYGQLPEQINIQRVLAAGPPASVLMYCLAPHTLLGWPHALSAAARAELSPFGRALPQLGRLSGRGSTLALETLLALKPDLIIDTGTLNDTYRSTARRTAQKTGVPYLLINGDILMSAQTLQALGALLNVDGRGQMLARQAQAILDDAALMRQKLMNKAPTFYAARGADGLETAPRGSIHVQALELCGLHNVVQSGTGLARVSFEQLLAWQPDYIFTHDATFHAQAVQSPYWQRLRAVRARRFVLAPAAPFGWLDMPPGMNRLLGVHWITQTLRHGKDVYAIRQSLIQFCEAFYQHPPSAALLDAASAFFATPLSS